MRPGFQYAVLFLLDESARLINGRVVDLIANPHGMVHVRAVGLLQGGVLCIQSLVCVVGFDAVIERVIHERHNGWDVAHNLVVECTRLKLAVSSVTDPRSFH